MTIRDYLQSNYHDRLCEPTTLHELPTDQQMVYILTFNDRPIVVGRGKRNRAKIVFDDKEHITCGHVKALLVRAYQLYGKGDFHRYIIRCDSKGESHQIENELHDEIGGNKTKLPEEIEKELLDKASNNPEAILVLRIALLSSFDGISDLRKWRRKGLLRDEVWKIVGDALHLEDPA